MSEPRWTPGPWENSWNRPDTEDNVSGTFGEEWGIRAADGKVVVGTVWYDGMHLLMRQEDGDLIAAAPDLYEALRLAGEVIDEAGAELGKHLRDSSHPLLASLAIALNLCNRVLDAARGDS